MPTPASLSKSYVYPTNDSLFHGAASRLRDTGQWGVMCEACLWQLPTNDGKPVHSERSAIIMMLNEIAEPLHMAYAYIGDFIDTLGKKRIARLLKAAGKREMDQEAWMRWKRILGIPSHPSDMQPELFADGWAICKEPAMSESYVPGTIPNSPPDENVVWECDENGEVFAVVA